ncbi:MAG TPA: PAS domain S-box protein [Methanospirillum sp.]|nr:PAS domain S-box protein [Methanospirillum sp.]
MTNKPIILCVDDEDDIRRLIGDILSDLGYEVLSVPSGEDALVMLEKHPDIDLILLDLMMPGLSGFDVLEIIRKNPETAEIPVIILSAQSQMSGKKEAFTGGANDYLVKPFESIELQLRIDVQIRLRVALQQERRVVVQLKDAQKSLLKSEARWQFALDGAGDGVWDWNTKTNEVFFSRQWKAMLGYGEEEIGSFVDEWDKRIHPDDRARCYADLERYFRGETPVYQNEHRVLCKDGTYKWILDRGKIVEWTDDKLPLRVIGTHSDITDRKHSEEEIKRQAGLIKSLIDSIPDIIFFKDIHGVYLGCNPPFMEFAGVSSEEIIGKTDYDLFDPNIADLFREHDKLMLESGEPRHNEEWIMYPDGRKVLLDTLKTPYLGPDGRLIGVLGISRDITEQNHAEEELIHLSNRLSLAARAGGVGIWDYDVVNNILTWDDQMFALYGITKDQFSGAYEAWQAGLHPDDKIRGDAEIQMALQREKEFNTEFRVLWPDGNIRTIRALAQVQRDTDGKPLHMIGTNWDITDIKRVEQNLKENEEKFISIFEENPDPLLILNQEYQIMEVNHGFERVFGYTHDEVLGRDLEELRINLTKSRINQMLENIEMNSHIPHEEISLFDKAGVPFIAEVSLSRIMIQSQPCLLVEIHDIDELRRAQDAVAQANKKLNILSSITRHDILNKVMVVSFFSQEVKMAVHEPDLVKDLDAVIQSSADIQSLIEFTRHYQDLGTTEPAWQEINLLLKRRSIQGLLTGIELISDLGALIIYSDRMLEKVLYNLVENSVRHGQHLTTIRFSCHHKEGDLIIWYEDDGGGIIEAEKEKAFKKGFGKNTGMGLFLIREILSITGISIIETGEPGVGVRFEILVPAGKFRNSPV